MQPSVLQRQSTSPRNPDTHLEAAALTPVPAPPRAPAPPSLHTTHKCKILGVFHSDAMQGAVAEAQGGSKLPHDLPSAYWRLEQILEKAFVREECTIAIIDTGIKISHKAFQGNRRLHAGSRILHIMNCLAAPDASDDIKRWCQWCRRAWDPLCWCGSRKHPLHCNGYAWSCKVLPRGGPSC